MSHSQPEPQVNREIEAKLRVPEDFQLPDLTGHGPVAQVIGQPPLDLTAVYHDTADRNLFRWKVTLRRRTGGHDAGWHLKLPVAGESGQVRDEVTLPLDAGDVGDVPAALCDLVQSLTRGQSLQPLATVRNHREPYLLVDQHGRTVAELVDDHVRSESGQFQETRFREIEVEADLDHDEAFDLLESAARILQQAGAEPSSTPKAGSALGPAAMMPCEVPQTALPGADEPAEVFAAALLAKHTRQFILTDIRVRRNLPDAVHKQRVSARRLRSSLQTFRPLWDPDWASRIGGELRWYARQLALARDTEVLRSHLEAKLRDLPDLASEAALSQINRVLNADERTGRTQTLAALHTQRYQDLVTALVDSSRPPTLSPHGPAHVRCADVLPPMAEKALKRLRRAVHHLNTGSSAVHWHEARKRAKRARYAYDALTPVFGESAKTCAKALEDTTEMLGELQDRHVTQVALQHIGQWAPREIERTLKRISVAEAAAERAQRDEFLDRWPSIHKILRHNHLDKS